MTTFVLGIDISRDKFDVALYEDEQHVASGVFDNNAKGRKKLNKWLSNKHVLHVRACLKATDRYKEEFALYLFEKRPAI